MKISPSLLKSFLILFFCFSTAIFAQEISLVPADQLPRVVPTGFYYEGQVAPTQMRNSAAVRVGDNKHVITALVDNSGYASDVRNKIEGFWATDLKIRLGSKDLSAGVYPFGVSKNGVLKLYDLSGLLLVSIKTIHDAQLSNPRPLAMIMAGDGLRFYRGRDYILVDIKRTTPSHKAKSLGESGNKFIDRNGQK